MNGSQSWYASLRIWDVYFAIGYSVVLVLVAVGHGAGTTARAVLATVALTAMAACYAWWGRPLILADVEGRRMWPFIAAQLVLAAAAVTAVPIAAYINFALSPLMFMSLPLGQAIAGAVAANLLPVAAALIGRADPGDTRTTMIMAVFGVALSVLMGVFIVRVIKTSEERLALIGELEASRAEVARLSRLAGVAEERSRLSGEIHDTLAQGFTSIITLLQAAGTELERDPARARGHVDLAVRTARENLAESRALVAALAPAALHSASLDQAIRRQTERLAEETGVAVAYAMSGDPAPLPTATEVVLLRAAQEALTNVRRHAEAAHVSVELAYTADRVTLTVRDDGRGFDPGRHSGFGLDGMRARAAQVDGLLTVDSAPGRGCTTTLEVRA
ncbi:MAG: sensor histidine kinase [Hamadaea sp.]|uniref:sensor histidine kinase n=1 Tax=Hamadaea sp. TaxID=2024425 RepID=UPI0017D3D214|nr:sensor histidine kinase [Hamadaea sp.]NUR73723.1 sensor histidine kinase [Hamadaea sp.]NUT19590.1 sensor histidine kinase [Hamadaea sp.]